MAQAGPPDPALRRCHGAAVRCSRDLRAWGERAGFPPPTADDHAACRARLDALATTDLGPTAQLAIASMRAGAETTWLHYAQGDVSGAYAAREAGMAATFHVERARVGGGRVVLLAHDDHVARELDRYTPLGARLAATLPYGAVAVGGFEVRSRLGDGMSAPRPAPGSAEHGWEALEPAAVYIDQRGQQRAHDGVLFLDEALAE